MTLRAILGTIHKLDEKIYMKIIFKFFDNIYIYIYNNL